MRTRHVLIGLAAVAVLAALVTALIPALLASRRAGMPAAPRAAPPAAAEAYWPTQGWRTSTPEEQGFDSARLAEGLQALRDNGVRIDSLLIIRNGYVLLDAYFYPYDGSFVHDLASVTKSFTTTLIAIAADQGKLQLDEPMISYLADRTIANRDTRKQAITVRQLAGMVNGFESGCIAGDEPTLDAMRAQPDWVQAALDRKMARAPGTSWCYDSPGMHILSAILQKATGMTELEFARQNLFEPLGIRELAWETDPQGYTHGWGDLHLKPLDAAKLGYLWLNNGVWEGKQIVPAAWVKDAVTAHVHAGEDDYGYGWWVSKDSYWAVGRGGQHVKVFPAFNAVVVTTASELDFDQIDPLLRASFVDPTKPLPANPEGAAMLEATLTALAQAPGPLPVAAVPETATAISGKTYVFGQDAADSLGLKTLRLEFNGSTEATLFLSMLDGDEIWPIGLDGRFRVSTEGQAVRGYWADPQTFVMEAFGQMTYQLHFAGDRLVISSTNLAREFEGQQPSP